MGPGGNEMALAALYDVLWDPGASETVGGDLLHLPEATAMLKVKAKVKKVKVKKFYMLKIAWNARILNKKNFSIQITLVDLASQLTAGNHDTHSLVTV